MPIRVPGRSSRASRAFSLVELTVMVVLAGLLAGAAMLYYREVAGDTRISIAQEELGRIGEEIVRWTLTPSRKMPRTTADLPRLGGQELRDPWGTPYVIQAEGGRIASAGPNRVLETSEFSMVWGDDLVAKFAPPKSHAPIKAAPF